MSADNIENLKSQDDIYSPLVQAELIQFIEDGTPTSDVIDTIIEIDSKRQQIQFGEYQRLKLEAASSDDWADARRADGVPILARKDDNSVKVNHRSHTPFDRTIVTNKSSYLMGNPPDIALPERLMQWSEANQMDSLMLELIQDSVGLGEGFALLYSPEGDEEAYITKEPAYYCVMLYDPDDMRPRYGLIYYPNLGETSSQEGDAAELKTNTYTCYWYDEENREKYEGTQEALALTEGPEPHLFAGVPLIEFKNNSERISDSEPVLGLMDLYDIMDSDLLSELSQLRLAYLVLKGMGLDFEKLISQTDYGNTPDWFNPEQANLSNLVTEVTKAGVFLSDNEKASVDFVNKQTNYEAVKYAKDDLKQRIYQMANSYDPMALSGVSGDVTAYQISQMMKPLEDSSSETVIHFTKALKYMFMLLANFYGAQGDVQMGENIEITFNRNIPRNIIQDIKQATEAGYRISQNNLARLIGLDINQEENEAELMREQDNMLIGFDSATDDSNDTE